MNDFNKHIRTDLFLLQVAKETSASKKRSGGALTYAVALAAIISVESPFVHIDGIAVRAPLVFVYNTQIKVTLAWLRNLQKKVCGLDCSVFACRRGRERVKTA